MELRRVLATLILILAVSFSSLCSAAALKYGDRGDEVKEIQEYLIAQCLLNEPADGVYGMTTVNAIKDFQSALGLEADGVCGNMTYRILRAAAYDEIDINTFKLGDYVPEYELEISGGETDTFKNSGATIGSVLSAVSTVKDVAQYAGVGDVIKLGMQGDGVIDLQNKLIEHGFYDGEVDGVCDADTVNALKDFQRSRGLAADGVCGRRTYSAFAGDEYYDESNSYTNGFPNYSRVVRVEATAYSSAQPGLSAYTATGTLCRYGVIATDPSFIPLGTRVYIPGYGYAVAEDTGGAIYGNRIDVAFDTLGECYEFGRQWVDLYILED